MSLWRSVRNNKKMIFLVPIRKFNPAGYILIINTSGFCWVSRSLPPVQITLPKNILWLFLESPLTFAAHLDNVVEMIKALKNGGAHLDFRAKDGMTALHKAARSKNQVTLTVKEPALLHFCLLTPACVRVHCWISWSWNCDASLTISRSRSGIFLQHKQRQILMRTDLSLNSAMR